MKTVILLLGVVAACVADVSLIQPVVSGPTSIYRTPALDSSYVESSRVGGNFAYRTVQGHAYQSVTPLAYAAYNYPTYSYLHAPLAVAPVPFLPYQPAFFEQPAIHAPIAAPASSPEKLKEDTQGRQVDDDTVAVESA